MTRLSYELVKTLVKRVSVQEFCHILYHALPREIKSLI